MSPRRLAAVLAVATLFLTAACGSDGITGTYELKGQADAALKLEVGESGSCLLRYGSKAVACSYSQEEDGQYRFQVDNDQGDTVAWVKGSFQDGSLKAEGSVSFYASLGENMNFDGVSFAKTSGKTSGDKPNVTARPKPADTDGADDGEKAPDAESCPAFFAALPQVAASSGLKLTKVMSGDIELYRYGSGEDDNIQCLEAYADEFIVTVWDFQKDQTSTAALTASLTAGGLEPSVAAELATQAAAALPDKVDGMNPDRTLVDNPDVLIKWGEMVGDAKKLELTFPHALS